VVRFVPPVAQSGLVDWYSAATLVCVPSYDESFGLVAVEAQATGTPVVAAAVGGLTTVVRDGHSGLLVEGHEPRDWAAALRRVLEDDDLRIRLEAGALEQARQFAWEHTAARTLDVYERARAGMREAAVS
jgi:D-inositol-3-phosphate glycosyltransferase